MSTIIHIDILQTKCLLFTEKAKIMIINLFISNKQYDNKNSDYYGHGRRIWVRRITPNI